MKSSLDDWASPQTIIALVALTILGATVGAVFYKGDAQTISQTVGGVLGIGGMVVGFYFNSSASSQRKDGTIGALTGADPAVSKTIIVSEPTPEGTK